MLKAASFYTFDFGGFVMYGNMEIACKDGSEIDKNIVLIDLPCSIASGQQMIKRFTCFLDWHTV